MVIAAIGYAIALIGVYVDMRTRIAKLETKHIDILELMKQVKSGLDEKCEQMACDARTWQQGIYERLQSIEEYLRNGKKKE